MKEIENIPVRADPELAQLFLSFVRLGITAFGGPAMIPYVRKMAVEKQHWIDGEFFQAGVALCQTIPGATVMQMAAFIGLKARGVRGAMVSYIGFILPAFLLMLALSFAYSRVHGLPSKTGEVRSSLYPPQGFSGSWQTRFS